MDPKKHSEMRGSPAVDGARVSLQQLRTLFDGLNIGVVTVDTERRVTSSNRAFGVLMGCEAADILGKRCDSVFLNDLCRGGCVCNRPGAADRDPVSLEIEVQGGDGAKRLIKKIAVPLADAKGRPSGCIEIFQDHSLFEDLLSRIRYDEQRLKMILDNLNIAVFTVTRGGHITFFNALAETLTGYDRREILGKPCTTILGDDSGRQGAGLLMASISDGKSRSDNHLQLLTKAGTSVPIQADCMALRNEEGDIIGGLATLQDLSLIQQLNREIRKSYTFGDMVGRGPRMQRIFETLSVVAPSDATLLIEGATGTGKDLLAKVTHNAGKRSGKPFIKVNCAALPEHLIESEMFGYVKGAFTGADRDKPGRFQEADGGTIFLDEIGDLPLSLQGKLLRVLEDREFYPLGSRRTTKVDVRIVAATNRGLKRLVREKRFREDLFYRLNVIHVELPELRERQADLPPLIEHFMKKLGSLGKGRANRISGEALEILLNYPYPGNIRELENILEHALILCPGRTIERKHLPLALQRGTVTGETGGALPEDPGGAQRPNERTLILETLERHHWRRGKAAAELNMNRTTLWRKMKKFHLAK